jgi:hypothetical protein
MEPQEKGAETPHYTLEICNGSDHGEHFQALWLKCSFAYCIALIKQSQLPCVLVHPTTINATKYNYLQIVQPPSL